MKQDKDMNSVRFVFEFPPYILNENRTWHGLNPTIWERSRTAKRNLLDEEIAELGLGIWLLIVNESRAVQVLWAKKSYRPEGRGRSWGHGVMEPKPSPSKHSW